MEETHNVTTLNVMTLDTHRRTTDDLVADDKDAEGRNADGRDEKIVIKQEVKLPKTQEGQDQIVQLLRNIAETTERKREYTIPDFFLVRDSVYPLHTLSQCV